MPVATADSVEPSESSSVAEATTAPPRPSLYCRLRSKVVTTGTAWIVKFVSEMSKKTFPTASTLIRAVVVPSFGRVTGSEPSLAVAAARTYG